METNEGTNFINNMALTGKIKIPAAQLAIQNALAINWINLDKKNNNTGGMPCVGTVPQITIETQKLVGKINTFIPFFPYTKFDISTILDGWFSIISQRLMDENAGALTLSKNGRRELVGRTKFCPSGFAIGGATTLKNSMLSAMNVIDDWVKKNKIAGKKCIGVFDWQKTTGGGVAGEYYVVDKKCVARKDEL